MKIFTLFATMLLVGIIWPCGAFAQNSKNAAIKEIDAYCKTIDAVVKRHKEPNRVFADTASETSTRARWRSFSSLRTLERFRRKQEVYAMSYSWLDRGKIVASNFTYSSPSGDWAKYIYHYFRPDGSLARVESDYRTFIGDFIVIRRRYFDTTGKQIGSSVKYLDLTTHKPKNAAGGVEGDDPKEVDYYKTTFKLPFARLLKTK